MPYFRNDKKPRRVWLIRPSYFIWVLVLLAGYGMIQSHGLPHLRSKYNFISDSPNDPFAYRYYTKCIYWGAYGRFTIDQPWGGKCPIFKLFTRDGGE